MSPRRHSIADQLLPRRTRRGRQLSAGSGGPFLSITSAPSSLQNRVTGPGASVRLKTEGGANLALAGVVVSARFQLGSSAALTTVPATAVTDVNGVATFTSMTAQGLAGTYGIEFTAEGYRTALAQGVNVLAGAAVATQSTANVPNGIRGQETVIRVELRDQDGNELTVAGTSTVTVQISGANTVAATVANFDAAQQAHIFRYVPANAGTDLATIRYGGTAIKDSPYTSVVATTSGGFTGNSLRFGLGGGLNTSVLGTGPVVSGGNWTTTEPIFRVAIGSLNPGSDFQTALALADDKNILIGLNAAGSRDTWTTLSGSCKQLSMSLYKSRIDRWLTEPGFYNALLRRRIFIYLIDEPWISEFCGSIWPHHVKDMARHVKANWPGCIIGARIEPQYTRGHQDWKGHILQPDGVYADQLPVNYFDKLDYMWGTWRGSERVPSVGMTASQFFSWAVQTNGAAGYGTMAGFNWINLGEDNCWDARDTGSSSARIHGDISRTGQPGVIEDCPTPSSDTVWAMEPSRIISVTQACASFPEIPFINGYNHPGYPGSPVSPVFSTYMKRDDYVTGFTLAIRNAELRTTFSGWRAAK